MTAAARHVFLGTGALLAGSFTEWCGVLDATLGAGLPALAVLG